MPATQSASAPINLLDLLRKNIYGATTDPKTFDFNSIFSHTKPVVAPVQIVPGNPGNDASPNDSISNADPAVGNAVGGLVATAVTSAVGLPGLSTAFGLAAHNSTLNNFQTIAEAMGLTQSAFQVADQAQHSIDLSQDENEAVGFADANENATGTSPAANAGESPDPGGPSGSDTSDNAGDYHFGGFVPGPDTGQDDKTINVTGGEVVIPHPIVQMLGRNFFEKILLTESPLKVAAEKAAKETSKGTT